MRKFFYVVVLISVSAFGFWLYWQWVAARFEDGFENWRRARMAEGYEIEHAAPELRGFPTTLEALLRAPRIAAPGGWRWQASAVTLEMALFQPNQMELSTHGSQEIVLTTEADGSRQRLVSKDSAMSVILSPDGSPQSGNGWLRNYKLIRDSREILEGHGAKLSFSVEANPPARDRGGLGFVLSLDSLDFSGQAVTPLEDRLHNLQIKGRVTGVAAEVVADASSAPSGKTPRIEIENIHLNWPPVVLSGTGELGLDEFGRPEGRLEAWWQDLSGLIDQLSRLRAIDDEAAPMLKLALLALPSRRGTDGTIERRMPIVAENGRLFLGPIEVARLRSLYD